MVTTRYSDQQGSKSRQKVMRLYKRWHRPISKRFIKPPYSIREQPRSTRNVVAYPRPAFSAKNRKNYAPTSFDQQVQVSQGHTFCTEIRKIEIPRSMCNLINTHTHTHTLIPPREDQCEWHRMTRMTGPDCVVMCNLINTHTHTHTHTHIY